MRRIASNNRKEKKMGELKAVTKSQEIEAMVGRLNGNINRMQELVESVEQTFDSVTRTASPLEKRTDETECDTIHAETLRQYSNRLENIIIAFESIISRSEL